MAYDRGNEFLKLFFFAELAEGEIAQDVMTLVEIPISIAISNVDFAPFAVFSLQEDVTTVSKELGHAKEGVTLENLFVEEMDACSMSDIV